MKKILQLIFIFLLSTQLSAQNPGDTIVVPVEGDPQDFDTTRFTSDIIAILTNLATIIFIINSNSN